MGGFTTSVLAPLKGAASGKFRQVSETKAGNYESNLRVLIVRKHFFYLKRQDETEYGEKTRQSELG
jgi:hypothetical protein